MFTIKSLKCVSTRVNFAKNHLILGILDYRWCSLYNFSGVRSYTNTDQTPMDDYMFPANAVFYSSDLNYLEKWLTDRRNGFDFSLIPESAFKAPREYILKAGWGDGSFWTYPIKKDYGHTWSGEYDFNTAPNIVSFMDGDVLRLKTSTAADAADIDSNMPHVVGTAWTINIRDKSIFDAAPNVQELPFILMSYNYDGSSVEMFFHLNTQFINAGLWSSWRGLNNAVLYIGEFKNAPRPADYGMDGYEIVYLEQ